MAEVWQRGVIFAETEWTLSACATVRYSGSVTGMWPSVWITDFLCQDIADCKSISGTFIVHKDNRKKAQC